MVATVADVDVVAGRIDSNRSRLEELTGIRTYGAEGQYELARGGEFLDPAIVEVGDVDVMWARRVDGDPVGDVELPVAGADRTECQQELAARGELLDPVIESVGDVDVVTALVDSDPQRAVQTAVAR